MFSAGALVSRVRSNVKLLCARSIAPLGALNFVAAGPVASADGLNSEWPFGPARLTKTPGVCKRSMPWDGTSRPRPALNHRPPLQLYRTFACSTTSGDASSKIPFANTSAVR